MDDPTFPEYPYRHVRPSLLFEVWRWAVVSVDTEEYYREWSLRDGDCKCDYTFHNGRQLIHHVGCNFLQTIKCGSQIEILGVCDGVDCDGLPHASASSNTGLIWGRHFFETGWIPTKYLQPMDIIVDDNVIHERRLRALQVPGHIRLEYLPFSPHFDSPYVHSIRLEHETINTIEEEIWETDSLGNFRDKTE